jgi:hypothetical protein
MEYWASRWAYDRSRRGMGNWDWNHSNQTFRNYFDRYGVELWMRQTDHTIQSIEPITSEVFTTTDGPNDLPSSFTFSHTVEVAESTQWTLGAAFTSGFSASAEVRAPGVGGQVGRSYEISVHSERTQTTTRTVTWSQTRQIEVPANTLVEVTMIVHEQVVRSTSNLIGIASGRVAIGLHERWNGHFFWFVPVADLARDYNRSPNITVVGNEVHCHSRLNFVGRNGIGTNVRIRTPHSVHYTPLLTDPFGESVGASDNENAVSFDEVTTDSKSK